MHSRSALVCMCKRKVYVQRPQFNPPHARRTAQQATEQQSFVLFIVYMTRINNCAHARALSLIHTHIHTWSDFYSTLSVMSSTQWSLFPVYTMAKCILHYLVGLHLLALNKKRRYQLSICSLGMVISRRLSFSAQRLCVEVGYSVFILYLLFKSIKLNGL